MSYSPTSSFPPRLTINRGFLSKRFRLNMTRNNCNPTVTLGRLGSKVKGAAAATRRQRVSGERASRQGAWWWKVRAHLFRCEANHGCLPHCIVGVIVDLGDCFLWGEHCATQCPQGESERMGIGAERGGREIPWQQDASTLSRH